MTTDTAIRHGKDAPCERTTCAEQEPHVGGVHLDPRSALYDGPDSMIRVLPLECRDAASALLWASRKDDWRRETVDVALDAMGRTITGLRQQVAHVQVDKDRQVRAAMDGASAVRRCPTSTNSSTSWTRR